MRPREEVIAEAARLKNTIVRRADRIRNLNDLILQGEMGTAACSQERIDTAKMEVAEAVSDQSRDTKFFATLRWVLDLTEDIDLTHLELSL